MKTISLAILGLIVCCWLNGCANQKDVIILDERLMVLERQNQEAQKRISNELDRFGKSNQSAETELRGQYAGIYANMEKLQQDTRMLSGQIEEISHQMDRKASASEGDLKTRLDKMEERLAQIERYLNMESSGGKIPVAGKAGGGTTAGPPESGAKELTAEQMYAAAKQAFDGGQMEKARQGFQQMLKTYPKSEDADNAQFWIGETYFNEKWYEKAILEYQAVIEKFPKGNKASAAMLKQGYAFIKLNDKANARLILKEIEKKYPKSNEAKIAAEKLKEL
ncbi:MAG: tol-pal system protein YbgF [Desulfatitalea sp.]